MTIAALLESLCVLIGDMAKLIDDLAMRLLQAGCMTEGELAQLREIQRRAEAIGISPPKNEKVLNSEGAGQRQ